MRNIVLAVLTVGLFLPVAGSVNAADLSPYHYSRHAHVRHVEARAANNIARIRVVEQVPYCGNCDNLTGPNTYNVALSYVGYIPWTRGCADGGCYGNYHLAVGCYWRERPVADGRGGWVGEVEKICN